MSLLLENKNGLLSIMQNYCVDSEVLHWILRVFLLGVVVGFNAELLVLSIMIFITNDLGSLHVFAAFDA
jgi:hypothetical protein